MKKLIAIIALTLAFAMAACAAPVPTNSVPNGFTIAETTAWPENDFTNGVPTPPGTVEWIAYNSGNTSCAISLKDVAYDEYANYMRTLEMLYFTILEESHDVIEEYESAYILLANDEKTLNINYAADDIADNMMIIISHILAE